jgi:hypothetical protein
MENKLILNLHLDVGDERKTCSLMNLVFRKIKQLQISDIKVEYFELRLRSMEDVPGKKEAYMKIDANDRTFIDSEISLSWESAIMNPCERIRQRFLRCAKVPDIDKTIDGSYHQLQPAYVD